MRLLVWLACTSGSVEVDPPEADTDADSDSDSDSDSDTDSDTDVPQPFTFSDVTVDRDDRVWIVYGNDDEYNVWMRCSE